MCELCNSLKQRALTTEEWRERHQEHGEPTREPFPHPSGKWFVLVCPCGAKHVSSEE